MNTAAAIARLVAVVSWLTVSTPRSFARPLLSLLASYRCQHRSILAHIRQLTMMMCT